MREIDRRLLEYARKGDLNSVVSALDAGADINIRDKDGWTALMLAGFYGHTEATDILIQAGADINIQDKSGNTALMFTVYWGHTEIADSLIQAGVDLFIRDEGNDTALDIAKRQGHPQTAELIEQRMAEQKRAELARSTESVEIHDMSKWL